MVFLAIDSVMVGSSESKPVAKKTPLHVQFSIAALLEITTYAAVAVACSLRIPDSAPAAVVLWVVGVIVRLQMKRSAWLGAVVGPCVGAAWLLISWNRTLGISRADDKYFQMFWLQFALTTGIGTFTGVMAIAAWRRNELAIVILILMLLASQFMFPSVR